MALSDIAGLLAEMGYPEEAGRTVAEASRYALRNLATKDGSVVKHGSRAEALWSLAIQR